MQERGFSLIELLIVIAIILVITAIAVPSLLHSRIAANEASAVYSIRTINTAQVTYATTYPTAGYSDDLSKLGAPTDGSAPTANNAAVLDWVLGCATPVCSKSGYNFSITNATSGGANTPISGYDVQGVPQSLGVSGVRAFCSNNMNPVLYSPDGTMANCNVPMN